MKEADDNNYPACIKQMHMNCFEKCSFVQAIGKSIGLDVVLQLWDTSSRYRIGFRSSKCPDAHPFVIFSYNIARHPCHVYFDKSKCVISTLEKISSHGHTAYVSNNCWHFDNIIWPAYSTMEQAMIELDLKGT